MVLESPCTLEDQLELLLDGLHVGHLDQPVVDDLVRFLIVGVRFLAGIVDDLGECVDAILGRLGAAEHLVPDLCVVRPFIS